MMTLATATGKQEGSMVRWGWVLIVWAFAFAGAVYLTTVVGPEIHAWVIAEAEKSRQEEVP